MDRIEFDGDNGRVPFIEALNALRGTSMSVNGVEMEFAFADSVGIAGMSLIDDSLSMHVPFTDEPMVVRYL